MNTKVLIFIVALIFSFNLNAQERQTLQRKGDVSVEKQLAKPDAQNLSELQGRKLAKYLNLSQDQFTSVTGLIEKYLNTDKYQKIIGSLTNEHVKTISKSPNFEQDYVSATLFVDESFTKELGTMIDTKQMSVFKELINSELMPK